MKLLQVVQIFSPFFECFWYFAPWLFRQSEQEEAVCPRVLTMRPRASRGCFHMFRHAAAPEDFLEKRWKWRRSRLRIHVRHPTMKDFCAAGLAQDEQIDGSASIKYRMAGRGSTARCPQQLPRIKYCCTRSSRGWGNAAGWVPAIVHMHRAPDSRQKMPPAAFRLKLCAKKEDCQENLV